MWGLCAHFCAPAKGVGPDPLLFCALRREGVLKNPTSGQIGIKTWHQLEVLQGHPQTPFTPSLGPQGSSISPSSPSCPNQSHSLPDPMVALLRYPKKCWGGPHQHNLCSTLVFAGRNPFPFRH